MPPGAAAFTVTLARFSLSVLLLPWDMVLGCYRLGHQGWKWIGDITIIGAIVLTCIPELFLGRYWQKGANSA
jgi:hypothetical protein